MKQQELPLNKEGPKDMLNTHCSYRLRLYGLLHKCHGPLRTHGSYKDAEYNITYSIKSVWKLAEWSMARSNPLKCDVRLRLLSQVKKCSVLRVPFPQRFHCTKHEVFQ